MGWVKDVLDAIKGDTSANRKLIIDGFKELMQEHKNEAKASKLRAEALMKELQLMRENEGECQRQLAQLRKDFLDLKEEIIFTRMLKDKPHNHTP